MPIDLRALRQRMDALKDSRKGAYYIGITDEERQMMERTAFNHFTDFGRALLIAPRLFSDLARTGANMKYMEANAATEAWGDKDMNPGSRERGPRE